MKVLSFQGKTVIASKKTTDSSTDSCFITLAAMFGVFYFLGHLEYYGPYLLVGIVFWITGIFFINRWQKRRKGVVMAKNWDNLKNNQTSVLTTVFVERLEVGMEGGGTEMITKIAFVHGYFYRAINETVEGDYHLFFKNRLTLEMHLTYCQSDPEVYFLSEIET